MILHGDYRKVLDDVKADLIFTSPPYNIGSKAPAKTGYRKNGQYDPKSYRAIREYKDDLPEDRYQESQVAFLNWCNDHLTEDGILVYNHKPRRVRRELIHPYEWIRQSSMILIDEIVWDRGSTHNHSPHMMWQTTERLYVMRKVGGKLPRINTKLPYRSDCWRINPAKVNGHNAPFPMSLAMAVIKAYSKLGDLVCDPYSGSGTTVAAALRLKRNAIGSERLKKYVLLAKDRISGQIHSNS